MTFNRTKRVERRRNRSEIVGDAGVAIDGHALRFPFVTPIDRSIRIGRLATITTRNSGKIQRNVRRNDYELLLDSHSLELVGDAVDRVHNRKASFAFVAVESAGFRLSELRARTSGRSFPIGRPYALAVQGLETSAADTDPIDGRVDIREWLNFAVGRVHDLQVEETKATQQDAPDDHLLQRPRVFYRREPEVTPFIIAILPSQ